ncbi:MAG: hypothetical protein Q9217_001061 [Psora testacea]
MHKFRTEVGILKALGEHPRIVQYLGPLDPLEPAEDLLFTEAVNGDVQGYLLRRLSPTVTRGGVFHCDLRPDNMLLNADLDLSLRYFGGSKNDEYDGEGLPDFGFFDPRINSLDVTADTEIFGLGSSMYTILAGHFPHGPSILKTAQGRLDYTCSFERLALESQFPDTSEIIGGDIIRDCWTQRIRSAEEAYRRLVKLHRKLKLRTDKN